MNLTTKSDRDKIDARAAQLIELDRWTGVRNGRHVENVLMHEFGINRQRAMSSISRTVRAFRNRIRQTDPAQWEKIRRGEYNAH